MLTQVCFDFHVYGMIYHVSKVIQFFILSGYFFYHDLLLHYPSFIISARLLFIHGFIIISLFFRLLHYVLLQCYLSFVFCIMGCNLLYNTFYPLSGYKIFLCIISMPCFIPIIFFMDLLLCTLSLCSL